MMIKRFFSAQPTRRFLIDILNENSGTILALGVIGSGTFGIGLYVIQMRVYEEKLNVYQEKINALALVAEEKINTVKMEAKKDILVAEEKINTVKMEAKKDSIIAEERARKEALQLLYNIFTQEEYKDAKKKMLAQKNEIVNSE